MAYVRKRLVLALIFWSAVLTVPLICELSLLLVSPGPKRLGGALPVGGFLAFCFYSISRGFGHFWNSEQPDIRQATRFLTQRLAPFAVIACGCLIGGVVGHLLPFAGSEREYYEHVFLYWCIGGAVAYVGIHAFVILIRRPGDGSREAVRGTTLLTFEGASSRAHALTHAADASNAFAWGGLALPEEFDEGGLLLVGAMGSGKTTLLRLLMQSVLPRIGRRPDHRAVVYDPKADVLSILSGMPLACPVHVLNPFDARRSAWDIAKDVTDPSTTLQIASILIPSNDTQNPYFPDAARAILAGVMKALMLRAPREWSLADVVRVIHDSAVLRRLLESVVDTRPLIDQYFSPEATFKNVHSTVASRMSLLEPIAFLWERVQRRVSLHDWVDGGSILVLGCHDRLREPLDAVNRVLFQRLSELALDRTESRSRRTWFFMDEVRDAGRLEGLRRLLTKGRSKGVRGVLGFQDIEGLRKVYGDHEANELAGVCANKSFLRLDSHETARWAALAIGQQLYSEYTQSVSSGPQGNTTSNNQHIVERAAVLASELMRLEPVATLNAIPGYHIVPAVGVYYAQLTAFEALSPRGSELDFVPRPVDDQFLRPFSAEDFRRLDLHSASSRGIEHTVALPRSPLDDC